MSYISFQSERGVAHLHGAVRASFRELAHNMLVASLSPLENAYLWIDSAVPKGHHLYWYRDVSIAKPLELFLKAGSGSILYRGSEVSCFEMALNTMLRIGSDPLKLAARICGQCEIHAFIEWKNRRWVADIIRQGRSDALPGYRVADEIEIGENYGWESVIRLLEACDEEPVVLSSSHCSGFPSLDCISESHPINAIEDADDRCAAFDNLSDEERWAACLQGLRDQEQQGAGLEIKPDNWVKFRFGSRVTGFQFLNSVM